MLRKVILSLIDEGVNEFWFGFEGNFDWLVRSVLDEIKKEYHIFLSYVCAYNPQNFSESKKKWLESRYEIIFPDFLRSGLPKFAIERRNKYLARQADVIVCYLDRKKGGAYRAVRVAEKYNKKIINLADFF